MENEIKTESSAKIAVWWIFLTVLFILISLGAVVQFFRSLIFEFAFLPVNILVACVFAAVSYTFYNKIRVLKPQIKKENSIEQQDDVKNSAEIGQPATVNYDSIASSTADDGSHTSKQNAVVEIKDNPSEHLDAEHISHVKNEEQFDNLNEDNLNVTNNSNDQVKTYNFSEL